jgi:uncharacterized small protein (DUF1192 family)
MSQEKDIDTMSVDELKEYIAILLNRIDDLERSKNHYERIAKALSK